MPLTRLVPTISLVALLAACGCPEARQEEANKELVQAFADAVNNADWDAFDVLLTDDFTRHCQATPDIQVHSRDEFKAVQEAFLQSAPDQHIDIQLLVAEGDRVAAYAIYSGTQTGAMGDIPPTGKRFESRFISIFRIENDRIAELWVEWDNLAILTQLGVWPPPQAGVEEEGPE